MERKRTDERRTEGKKKKWAGLPFGGEFLFLTFLRLWPAPSSLVSALCASFALHSIIIIIIKDNNKAAATGRRLSHAIYFSPSSSSSSSSSSFLPLLVVLLPVSGFCCGNPEAATGGLHFPVWFDSFLTCLPFFLPFRFVLFAPPSFLRWLAAPFYLTSYFVPFRRGVRSVSLFASSAFFFHHQPPPWWDETISEFISFPEHHFRCSFFFGTGCLSRLPLFPFPSTRWYVHSFCCG